MTNTPQQNSLDQVEQSITMSTEFTAFQSPPGEVVKHWDRKVSANEQSISIPHVFREAMEVREEVFVDEQAVPLENELDDDDARSFHWVVYASVGTVAPIMSARTSTNMDDGSPEGERRKSESTASRLPVGTIRLIPPPHMPHHLPDGRSYKVPGEDYIKLGRLAVLPPYRGLGLSKLLINAALKWAKENSHVINPPLNPAEVEAARLEGRKSPNLWSGRILVHSQLGTQKVWESFGFVRDEDMGEWDEEGIHHVGMWRSLELKADNPRISPLHSPSPT